VTSPTPYLDEVVEFMHGHRKKTLFFLEALDEHARLTGRAPRELRVLDLGCGNGRIVSLPLAEHGFDVTGVDVHPPSIDDANAHNRLSNARFVCSDVADYEDDAAYDAVVLSDILEHVDDPDALLDTAVSQLAADGIVLVSVPNGRGPYELEQRLVGGRLRPIVGATRATAVAAARLKRRLRDEEWPPPTPVAPAYNTESGHVQFLTLERFRRLLDAHGLRIERWRNGIVAGGDLTYFLFYAAPVLVRANVALADRLPARFVSTWYVSCRRKATA
jgi:2-polyprenyl-3-methyl-5-hydroxy-6-metoxy-1,4-benzoquinol methylase